MRMQAIDSIPLFPLDTVLFPGMPLYLHIFEERYRQMLKTCLAGKQMFGVVLIQQGSEALGPLATPHRVGTTARIMQVEHLADGCSNITVLGLERFLIHKVESGPLPYLTGSIQMLPLENPRPLEVLRGLRSLRMQVKEYLKQISQFGPDGLDLSDLELPDEALTTLHMAASLLQIPTVEKQPILAAETAARMLQMLARLYRREIAMMEPQALIEEEDARRKARLN